MGTTPLSGCARSLEEILAVNARLQSVPPEVARPDDR
jgi:hypothetical protein